MGYSISSRWEVRKYGFIIIIDKHLKLVYEFIPNIIRKMMGMKSTLPGLKIQGFFDVLIRIIIEISLTTNK